MQPKFLGMINLQKELSRENNLIQSKKNKHLWISYFKISIVIDVYFSQLILGDV